MAKHFWMEDSNVGLIKATVSLMPNTENRLDLRVFKEDTSVEDDEGPVWEPCDIDGKATLTPRLMDIPCNSEIPFALCSSPVATEFIERHNLGTEVYTLDDGTPLMLLNLGEIAAYDPEGVNSFILAAERKPEMKGYTPESKIKFSDKFAFVGQTNRTNAGEVYPMAVFRTPYEIDGERVYMRAGQHTVARPDDPGCFELYTTKFPDPYIDAIFSLAPASRDGGEFLIPRKAISIMSDKYFKYSDATRGAENYGSFNKPIKNVLTGEIVTKEQMTKEIMKYTPTTHLKLHLVETERQHEYERDRERDSVEGPSNIPDMVQTYEVEEMEPMHNEFEMGGR